MELPVRKYQKEKDYQRHKLFRKMKRRRRAQVESAKDAPMRMLRRKLGIPKFASGKDVDERILKFVGNDGRIVDDLGDDMMVLLDESDGYGDNPAGWTYINDRTGETYTPAVSTDNGTIEPKGRWSGLSQLAALSNQYRNNPILGSVARAYDAWNNSINNPSGINPLDIAGLVATLAGASSIRRPLTPKQLSKMSLQELGDYFKANPYLLKDIEVTNNVRNFYNNDVLPRLAKQTKKPLGFTADDLIQQLKFKAGNFEGNKYGGYYSADNDAIVLNDRVLNDPKLFDRVLTHEISHGMYNRVGYAPEAASKLEQAYKFSPEYLATHPGLQRLPEMAADNTATRLAIAADNGWLTRKPLDKVINDMDPTTAIQYYNGPGASAYARDWAKSFTTDMGPQKRALIGVAGTLPFITNKDSVGYKDGKLPRCENGYIQYKVKKGDWLSKIARDMTSGIGTYPYLASYNNLKNPDRIEVGQILRIPKSILKGATYGSIDDVKAKRDPQKQSYKVQPWQQFQFEPVKLKNSEILYEQELPEVIISGKKKNIKQPQQWKTIPWQEPQQMPVRDITADENLNDSQNNSETPIQINRQLNRLIINSSPEQVDSLYVSKIPNRSQNVEDLNSPGWISSKLNDIIDTIKENSGDIEGLFQTAWNGVAKYFTSDSEVKTKKRNIVAPKKQVKESDVIDEQFAKESRSDGDTLLWDRVPVDKTKNKYYIQRSYPITDDMVFGSRNRGEYADIDSNNMPLTTYRPIHPYETWVSGFNYLNKRYQASQYDSAGHENHFMGYDKNGKFKVGPLSAFGPGDTMTQVYYSDIIDVPRDQNGNLIYQEDKTNPGRYQPVVNSYGENVVDSAGVVHRGNRQNSVITTMTQKRNKNGKYGNVSGGRVLLVVGNEKRIVEGSIDGIIQEVELMQKNHKGKPIRYYQLDNGSYNRGLSTRNGKNITIQDLKDYDRQNTATAGGGHAFYIRNK